MDQSPAEQSRRAEAIARLWDEYGRALALYAGRFCRDAEDCVQEALFDLARKAHWPERPANWLFRVVRNKAISQQRRLTRRGAREAAVAVPAVQRHNAIAGLTEGLASLESIDQELVILRIWGNQTFAEISELTDKPITTLHRRYRAALDALRHYLEPPCQTPTN